VDFWRLARRATGLLRKPKARSHKAMRSLPEKSTVHDANDVRDEDEQQEPQESTPNDHDPVVISAAGVGVDGEHGRCSRASTSHSPRACTPFSCRRSGTGRVPADACGRLKPTHAPSRCSATHTRARSVDTARSRRSPTSTSWRNQSPCRPCSPSRAGGWRRGTRECR